MYTKSSHTTMHLNIILALSTAVSAFANLGTSGNQASTSEVDSAPCSLSKSEPSITSVSSAPPPSKISAASASLASTEDLSLTQQLLLAETVSDRFDLLSDDQFVFDFNRTDCAAGKNDTISVADRKSFPALLGTGISMAVGYVSPCGLNTFHVHPRSAELQMVIKGRLVTEQTLENESPSKEGNYRVIKNEIGPYQMTPFYQGAVHAQFNPDCEDAVFIASFANEDPGSIQVLNQAFSFTDDVIRSAFGYNLTGEDLQAVRNTMSSSLSGKMERCLEQCSSTS